MIRNLFPKSRKMLLECKYVIGHTLAETAIGIRTNVFAVQAV